MDTYFSIGELAKLCNLPIKTLRYYDEIGLLKPAYINTENNYRYYSVEQFISIDVIKNCKLMDMSLSKIKKILDSNVSIGEMLETINKQSELVEQKILALSRAKTYMDTLQSNLSDVLKNHINEAFIKYIPKRYYLAYAYSSENVYELEMNIRKVLLDIERKQEKSYGRLGTGVSYEQIATRQKVVHQEFRNFSKQPDESPNGKWLPEGEYVTLIFDNNSSNTLKYYQKSIEYIEKHGLEVEGIFNETWIMPRVDDERKEKTLTQIDILIKK